MPERTAVVLLDAFGTLLTLEDPRPALRALLRERLGVEVSESEVSAALGAEVAFYRAHMHLGRDAASVADLHRRCAEVLRSALPEEPRLSAAAPQTLTAILLESLRFSVYPEVPETLARLRAAGLRLVVVSNWDASLEQVLVSVGLRLAVDGVVSSAAVGAAKPDPLPLRRGLALAGVQPGEAIHVGDGEREDVEAARAAAVTPVLLRRGGGGAAAGQAECERVDRGVATINSLAELPELLGL